MQGLQPRAHHERTDDRALGAWLRVMDATCDFFHNLLEPSAVSLQIIAITYDA